MRLLAASLLLLVGTACPMERYSVRDRACAEKFEAWDDDIVRHLVKGNQRAGAWSYNPAGELVAKNAGRYQFDSGDFNWTVTYHPDHWRERTVVDGFGYVALNGDLDVQYEVETEDIDGDETSYEVRMIREGCDVEVVYANEAGSWAEVGEYLGGRYEYEQDLGDATIEGVRRSDGSWTETYESDGYSQETRGDDDGYAITEFEGDGDLEGTTETFLDGSEVTTYSYEDGGVDYTWSYTLDWDGDGEGTVEVDGDECTIEIDNCACEYDCDGETGDCGEFC